MRAVIGGLLVPALVLLLCVSALATTVVTDIYDDGTYKTYTYTVSCDEVAPDGAPDYVSSFHVFAPVNLSLVTGWCDNTDWTFGSFFDTEISAADIYWDLDTTASRGLANGDSLSFCMKTSSSVPTISNYVIDGALGNWGLVTEFWAEYGTYVMMPSVGVPNQMLVADIPEPASLLILFSGISGLAILRRRK